MRIRRLNREIKLLCDDASSDPGPVDTYWLEATGLI